MTRLRITAVFEAPVTQGRTPPKEIQLWNAGDNPTDYGVHVWNERSTREVLARYNERGNPILVDVEHNGATKKDGEPSVTAGYARLEMRAGAPWLVFDWSEYGREQIASGQRRFLSPEYDVDKKTGEILALYRVSLVADPGTHRARMLAAALTQEKKMDLSVILAAIRAALAAEDPAVAKESLTNLLAELEKSAGEPSPEAPTEPVTTESGDEEPKDQDKDKMAATVKPKADPVAKPKAEPTKPSPDSQAVTSAATAAVAQIRAAHRDHLIATQGDRLEPSLRRWASSQPLEVVESFLAAVPAKEGSKERAKATRGDGATGALTERELQKCKAKGIDPAKYAANKAVMFGKVV